ncbi:MAG TPA: porin, partial [Polyangiales bacterium]|nr:porin [Polyangiales bacterium]
SPAPPPTAAPEPPPAPPPPPPSAAEEPPPTAAKAAEGDEDSESERDPDSKWPVFKFQARVMTGVELVRKHPENGQAATEETETGFFLDDAVIEAEVQVNKLIELELGFNLNNATVRDAFINVHLSDAVQLRAGRFKRPFSRLELRSIGKLPFRNRGLFNELLTDNNFAGRTLAGMVWGEPLPGLRYSLAFASPAPIGADIEGLDVIGRIVYDPSDSVSIGWSAMHKWSQRSADGEALRVTALGIDSKLDFGPLTVGLEADVAQNPNPPPVEDDPGASRTPWSFGVIGYADYAFKLSKKWTLAPVVVLEWMDTDTEYSGDERVRAVGGLSWNYRKNALRVMPQVEITRPLGGADPRGEVASETYYLMVSGEI